MDLNAWLLYASMAAVALAAAVAHYRLREPEGPGRMILGATRGTTLSLLLLLLFDPLIPAGAPADRATVAVVDFSLSMALPTTEGTRWEEARARLEALEPDRVQTFGAQPAVVSPETALASTPAAGRSLLAPALRAAVESGAGRVVVITDGAIEDATEAAAVAARSVAPVEVRRVGEQTLANLSIRSVAAPAWLAPGEEATVAVELERVGAAGPPLPDRVTVTLLREGSELATTSLAAPAPGGTTRAELPLRLEPGAGEVRLRVAVAPGGSVTGDDTRTLFVQVGEPPPGVVLVSFRPDQEPRFLLPVLERSLGLPVRGWLGVGPERYLRIGSGSGAGAAAAPTAVREAVAGAELVVLHGVSADAPDWARRELAGAQRVLAFPADPVPELPGEPGPVRPGEWYVAPDLPPSPVAGLLAGLETDLPPLNGLRTAAPPESFWSPVEAQRGRRGPTAPAVIAGTIEGRRRVVALGSGYWRWSFSGPEGRRLYRGLWSALAGWLLEGDDAAEATVGPVERVVPRGSPVVWRVPGGPDSVRVVLTREGAAAPDGVEARAEVAQGRAVTAAPEPGDYRYSLRGEGLDANGRLTVEGYAEERNRPVVALDLESGEDSAAPTGESRPLHTSPWPYLALVALLSAEWVLRRRWGLR